MAEVVSRSSTDGESNGRSAHDQAWNFDFAEKFIQWREARPLRKLETYATEGDGGLGPGNWKYVHSMRPLKSLRRRSLRRPKRRSNSLCEVST